MHLEIARDCTWRRGRARFLHQVHRRGPVAVAIEERAADSAVEDAVELLVIRLRAPFANQIVAFLEASDAKAFVVRGTASEAAVIGRVGFLNALQR